MGNYQTQGMSHRPAEKVTNYLTKQATDSQNALLIQLPTD